MPYRVQIFDTIVTCETPKEAIELAEEMLDYCDFVTIAREEEQEKAAEQIAGLKVLIETLTAERDGGCQPINDLTEELNRAADKIAELEKSLGGVAVGEKAETSLPVDSGEAPEPRKTNAKWPKWRAEIVAYLEEHGPAFRAELVRQIGFPSGSQSAILNHSLFRRLDDGRVDLANGETVVVAEPPETGGPVADAFDVQHDVTGL